MKDMYILCYLADMIIVSLNACVASCLSTCDTDRELAQVIYLEKDRCRSRSR
jgi:nitrate reductase beta subunit